MTQRKEIRRRPSISAVSLVVANNMRNTPDMHGTDFQEGALDLRDDGKRFGEVFGAGRIGFRQMPWTRTLYRNFRVYFLKGHDHGVKP